MKDIAQDLGVSVVTVSKVLRNHSDISAETRERVLKRMKELNYRPNLAARALVTGKSYFMGLSGCNWSETRSSRLPPEYQIRPQKAHNALSDAQAQSAAFLKLLHAHRR